MSETKSEMDKVTRDSFDVDVLQSEVPVVVDFWGPRCVPCIRLEPSVVALSEEMAGTVKFMKVIAPENRMLCVQLRVMSLPTFLAFKNGEEIGRLTGDVPFEEVEKFARALV